ncbi:MAG: chorismate--pyruvate lyase family protein [Polynucleobacter victoriensis]
MKKLRQSWVNLDHVALHAVPQIWQDWLSDAGSLTQLIANKTQSPVSVEVLSDRNQNLLNDEALLFNQPLNHCRIREVYLCVNDLPVVFARSILPTSSSTGINRDVLQLGSKPLGEVLFKKGKAPILLRQITELSGLGWGRRSLYQLRGHPILISEFFLPELLAQIKS